ncbi:MAG TPA: hypothetical protein DCY35_11505 [Prolixibacteraceae bacterium]|nr:hypothetical protein [Prolixibacteraceae bacterium]
MVTIRGKAVFNTQDPLKLHVKIVPHTHDVVYHEHEFHEIVYVEKGFMIHYYMNKHTLITAGDLFYIRPGESHKYTLPQHAIIYNCLFSWETIAERLDDLVKLPWIGELFKTAEYKGCIRLKLDPVFGTLLKEKLNEIKNEMIRKEAGWMIKAKYIFYDLIVDISRYYIRNTAGDEAGRKQMRESQWDYIYKAIEYMEGKYPYIQVRDVAAHLGLSYSYFYHLFKNSTGTSPIEYLRNVRLSNAVDLMRNTHTSITQVAIKTGYSNIAFFSKQFKQVFGVAPTIFIRSYYGREIQ